MMNDPLRILIVDDDQNMAKTLADILMVKGYQVFSANSGVEALDKVRLQPLDCVLSDIRMPDIDGVEMYKTVKTIQPALPVVLMTAYATDTLVTEGLGEGVIAVMPKPLNINRLLGFFAAFNQKCCLIVVNDNPQLCLEMTNNLQERGFHVIQIESLPRGTESLMTRRGIILLNRRIREERDLDLFRRLMEQQPSLSVTVVTSISKSTEWLLQATQDIEIEIFHQTADIEEIISRLIKASHRKLGQVLKVHY